MRVRPQEGAHGAERGRVIAGTVPGGGGLWHDGGERPRLPGWLKIRLPGARAYPEVLDTVRDQSLHTVCQSARCPNLSECWARGTATFLILGNICTRRCGFCAVPSGRPHDGFDEGEAERVARAVLRLGIRHAVVTSVDRDDLDDGGSTLFARVIEEIRREAASVTVEVLTPDFRGDPAAIARVAAARPEIFAHNLETVPRLYRTVRPGSSYRRSMGVLAEARRAARDADARMLTKTSLMLGLGERNEEVFEVMAEARAAGVDIVTLGQYLQPDREHLPAARFVPPDEFGEIARKGRELGLRWVEAGPLVRSSYRSETQLALLAPSAEQTPAGDAGTAPAGR
jgi:lipoic acid synthetase